MIDFEQDYLMQQSTATRIKVIGIGGAGGNTINHMMKCAYENVEFIAVNTDAQALRISQAPLKLQIGSKSTRGLGAGSNPEVGKQAAEEDSEKISECLRDADMIFLTAGLGGGTGSGAVPVIARIARELGILNIAVVTKPFAFEGKRRMTVAEEALEKLRGEADTLMVVPNQKLIDVADNKLSLIDAFGMINDIVHQFVKSVADIIACPGHINVDFADICAIMRNTGLAVMGNGRASGVDRAQKAALQAISSPLLENAKINGARAVLLNITGNARLGLQEVHSAASIIHEAAENANIIMGSVIDESMEDEVLITVIATGMEPRLQPAAQPELQPAETQPVAQPAVSPAPTVDRFEEFSREDDLNMRPAQSHPDVTISQSLSPDFDQISRESPIDFKSLRDIDTQDIEIPALLRRMKDQELQNK